MRITFLMVLVLAVTSCATWKSPINQNSLLGVERTPSDGVVNYHGSIDASEGVSYFLQSGGRQIRLRFDLTVIREDGKISLSFTRADFGASLYYEYQDLVLTDYKAETQSNKSFNAEFVRHPIDEQMLVERIKPYKNDSAFDERSLLEVLRLLFIYIDMEKINSSAYVGNQTLKNHELTIFGHVFTLASFSTVSSENQGLFTVDIESRLSASYLHRYEPKNSDSDKSDGSYYSLWGQTQVRSNYNVGTLLLEDIDLPLNIGGYEQAYFSDEGKLYMLWPTNIRVHIKIERAKKAS